MNIAHLTEKYELNDLEIQFLQYLQENLSNLKSIGIRKMAQDNYTSTSAIYKFCNKLGFSGYSDMIFSLRKEAKGDSKQVSQIYEYETAFHQLLHTYQNKKIIVFGMGFSSSIADYINQRLTIYNFSCMSVIHIEMLDYIHNNDCLFIVISQSAITPRLLELVQNAHKNNIDILTFSANKDSKLKDISSLFIHLGKYNSFSYNNMDIPNTFFGEVIIAFETLLCTYFSST